MADITAAAILAAEDTIIEEIAIPEWGGSVFIRSMTGQERDTWEIYAQSQISKKVVNIRARLAVVTLCDKHGSRLFQDSDTAKLAEKSAKPLDRIYEAAIRINGLSPDEVEEIEKN